jgi:hypothetical protein
VINEIAYSMRSGPSWRTARTNLPAGKWWPPMIAAASSRRRPRSFELGHLQVVALEDVDDLNPGATARFEHAARHRDRRRDLSAIRN